MVSLNTILAIGGIGAAYLIFKNLGGAAGIGSSIGQGFNVNSGNFFEQTPIEERFPNARVATYSERTQLANLTGGLLG